MLISHLLSSHKSIDSEVCFTVADNPSSFRPTWHDVLHVLTNYRRFEEKLS